MCGMVMVKGNDDGKTETSAQRQDHQHAAIVSLAEERTKGKKTENVSALLPVSLAKDKSAKNGLCNLHDVADASLWPRLFLAMLKRSATYLYLTRRRGDNKVSMPSTLMLPSPDCLDSKEAWYHNQS